MFDRLLDAAVIRGQTAAELEEFQHVAHANGGFDVHRRGRGQQFEHALVATARSELATLGDVDLESDDGTYRVSLEKLLALARP